MKGLYFWNVKGIAGDLKTGQVSEKQKFAYFFVSFAIIGKITSFFAYSSYYSYTKAFWDTFLGLIIAAIGLYFCYKSNSDGDDKDFIARFFCISFPIIVRLYAITLLLFAIELGGLLALNEMGGDAQAFATSFLDSPLEMAINGAIGHILDIVYYLWVKSTINFVSGAS